jgi:4-alpha-glucanotransferase
MAVLQFGFNPDDHANTHHPANLEQHQVVYTGTHDNDTVCGWWRDLPEAPRAMVRAALQEAGVAVDADREPSWALIGLALDMPCELAMMQAQDVLALGSEARMNAPGIEGGWSWQMEPGALTDAHADRLRGLTEAAGRC